MRTRYPAKPSGSGPPSGSQPGPRPALTEAPLYTGLPGSTHALPVDLTDTDPNRNPVRESSSQLERQAEPRAWVGKSGAHQGTGRDMTLRRYVLQTQVGQRARRNPSNPDRPLSSGGKGAPGPRRTPHETGETEINQGKGQAGRNRFLSPTAWSNSLARPGPSCLLQPRVTLCSRRVLSTSLACPFRGEPHWGSLVTGRCRTNYISGMEENGSSFSTTCPQTMGGSTVVNT